MIISDFSIAFTIKTADICLYNRSVIGHIFYYITHVVAIGNLRILRILRKMGELLIMTGNDDKDKRKGSNLRMGSGVL